MTGLIVGGFTGALVAWLAGFLITLAIYTAWHSRWERILRVARVVIVAAVFVTGCTVGSYAEWHSSRQYIATFTAVQQTIETSVQNEALSGLERVELVKQAAECNQELAAIQYNCRQWYGFNLDKHILQLSPINLAGQNSYPDEP